MNSPRALPEAVPRRRIVLYLDHTAKMGGGEIALLNLVCALDPERYRPIVVLASQGPLVDQLTDAGIEVQVLLLDSAVLDTRKDGLGIKSLLRLGYIWACIRYAFRLAKLARQLHADLIHTNSLKSDLYGGLAGRLAGIPVLWHIRDSIDDKYLPRIVAATFRRLCRVVPQAVIANSESTLRTLTLPQRKIAAAVYSGVALQVIHDGYDPEAFPESTRLPPESSRRDSLETPRSAPAVVSMVGRIASWKGQDIFIQAASLTQARFPETRFQIIGAPLFGEYEYEAVIHQLVEDLGLQEQIAFLGFRSDVPALLAKTDILVHASTLGEPFGQVVIEGMAAGKPVIATDGGALPEIVLPGKTGLLVPMGDAPAMAAAIEQLLSNPELAGKMGEAGSRRVQEHFTIGHTAARLEAVYDRLLGKFPVNSAS